MSRVRGTECSVTSVSGTVSVMEVAVTDNAYSVDWISKYIQEPPDMDATIWKNTTISGWRWSNVRNLGSPA